LPRPGVKTTLCDRSRWSGRLPAWPKPTPRNTFMAEHKRIVEKDPAQKKDDLIVITGAGGFIAGNLALHFTKAGFTNIRAVDKKPLYEWYLHVPGVENLCLDVSIEDNCKRVCEGAVEVYNLAAD